MFELQAGRHVSDWFACASKQFDGCARGIADKMQATPHLAASGAVDGQRTGGLDRVSAGLGLVSHLGGKPESQAGEAVGGLKQMGCLEIFRQFEVTHFLCGGDAVEINGGDCQPDILQQCQGDRLANKCQGWAHQHRGCIASNQ